MNESCQYILIFADFYPKSPMDMFRCDYICDCFYEIMHDYMRYYHWKNGNFRVSCLFWTYVDTIFCGRVKAAAHRPHKICVAFTMSRLTIKLLWGCLWCNCYRRRKWTRRHEFKSWTRLIAFLMALIPLGKVWIQSFSLQLWVNSRTD